MKINHETKFVLTLFESIFHCLTHHLSHIHPVWQCTLIQLFIAVGIDDIILTFLVLNSGPHLNVKTVFPGMGISIMKIRLSWDSLIFIMGIPYIRVRQYLYIEMAPGYTKSKCLFQWDWIANENNIIEIDHQRVLLISYLLMTWHQRPGHQQPWD